MIMFDVFLLFMNRFYLCFDYKVGTNQVLLKQGTYFTYVLVSINQVILNRRIDWDLNPKVHRIVPVLWRFTNPNPNRSRTKLSYNPNVAVFDKPKKPKSDWTKPKPNWDPECPCPMSVFLMFDELLDNPNFQFLFLLEMFVT